jgi:hypothetical protein
MSRTSVEQFEGGTFKLEVQKVNLTYHGPTLDSSGGGVLAQIVNEIRGGNSGSQGNPGSNRTTVSEVIHQEATSTMNTSELMSRIRGLKLLCMGTHAQLNRRVRNYFDAIEEAKATALGGNEAVYLGRDDLAAIRDIMSQYNVGWVLKCKIQVRFWSGKPFAGAKELAQGGYSRVKVLATWYMPGDMSLDECMAHLRELWSAGTAAYDVSKKQRAILAVGEDGRMTITARESGAYATDPTSDKQYRLSAITGTDQRVSENVRNLTLSKLKLE